MLTELNHEELNQVQGGNNFVVSGPNGTGYIRDNGDGTVTTHVQFSDGTWGPPVTTVLSEA
jgi:bacteriocin-like protein